MLQILGSSMKEQVNHPDHYKSGKFEVIEIIEEFKLGFNLGNVVKYVLRAGKKNNAVEALEWYAIKGEGPYSDARIYRRAESALETLRKAGLA